MKTRSASLRRKVAAFTFTTIAALLAAGSTVAAEHRPGHPAPLWRGDIHHFHEHDWNLWRAGHWTHGRHDGRLGWWWVAGGLWYFYPSPVYPYPSPWEPPAVTIVSPPAGSAPPPPATDVWYFCAASNAYYPYVVSCPAGWKAVPATPAPH